MAWFRVHVLLQSPQLGTIAREAEYAVAAMDAMDAEDKAETLASRENPGWRCLGSAKTVKFSNSAQPRNDVEDGERLSLRTLEFSDESNLASHLAGQPASYRVLPEQ